jgi:hypothetical protein
MFVYVRCRCGRTLRTERAPVDALIRCWECQEMARVPAYRQGVFTWLTERYDRAMYSTRTETFGGCVAAALLVVCALFVPRYFSLLALLALGGFAAIYPQRIARAWLGEEELQEAPTPRWLHRMAARVGRYAFGLVLAVGFVGPLWFGQAGPDVPGPFPEPAEGMAIWGVALALWIAMPLATYLMTASDEDGRLGPRRAFAAAARRPGALLGALLCFPAAMLGLEVATILGLWVVDWYQLWVFDLFPVIEPYRRVSSTMLIPRELTGQYHTVAWHLYFNGISHGSTLIAANPLSLHHGLDSNVSITAFGTSRFNVLPKLEDWTYFFARICLSMIVLTLGMAVLAAQSHWLGRIGCSEPAPERREEKKLAVVV